MGVFNLYDWGLPSKAAYLNRYQGDDNLYNAARSLWNSMDTAGIYFLISAIAVGLILVLFYYYGYNRFPGRKYKISHWAIWLGITSVVTILLTLIFGNILVSSNLKEQSGFILRISLINGLYSAVVYLLATLIICNIPVPTNAYRFLKIGK